MSCTIAWRYSFSFPCLKKLKGNVFYYFSFFFSSRYKDEVKVVHFLGTLERKPWEFIFNESTNQLEPEADVYVKKWWKLYQSLSILYQFLSILYQSLSILYQSVSILYQSLSILYQFLSILYQSLSNG